MTAAGAFSRASGTVKLGSRCSGRDVSVYISSCTVFSQREVGIGWMYMDVIIGDPCDDVCDICVTFVTQNAKTCKAFCFRKRD